MGGWRFVAHSTTRSIDILNVVEKKAKTSSNSLVSAQSLVYTTKNNCGLIFFLHTYFFLCLNIVKLREKLSAMRNERWDVIPLYKMYRHIRSTKYFVCVCMWIPNHINVINAKCKAEPPQTLFTRPKIHYTHVHINFNLAAYTASRPTVRTNMCVCVLFVRISVGTQKLQMMNVFVMFFFVLLLFACPACLMRVLSFTRTHSQYQFLCVSRHFYYAIHSQAIFSVTLLPTCPSKSFSPFFLSLSYTLQLSISFVGDLQIIFSC